MEKVKKKILVLGSSGMLGHILVQVLSRESNFRIFNISREKKIFSDTIICDVLDFQKLSKIISEISPDIIINSIGVLVNDSEINPINAILLNSCFPLKLKEIADRLKSKVIHISTDCVYDGIDGSYNEKSKKSPVDIYGKTKDLGEIISDHHLTIRTSIIGPEIKNNGTGLFLWLTKNKNLKVEGYDKSIWSGLTTLELSNAIVYCIKSNLLGILNIGSMPISKYNLLEIINKEFNLNIEIKKVDGLVSDKTLISLRKDFLFKLKSHEDMIKDLRLYIESSKFKY